MRRTTLLAVTVTAAAVLAGCGAEKAPAPAAPAPSTGDAAAPPVTGVLSLVSGTANSNQAQQGTGDWAQPGGGPQQPELLQKSLRWVAVRATKAGDLDPVVVNGAGLTLYRFDDDDANPSKSVCNGACAQTWPPVLVDQNTKVFRAGVRKNAIGAVRRDDGTLQLTIGGWPVYRFAKDTRPGDTKGQGVQGTWFGVTPTGERAGGGKATEQPQQRPSSAPAETGDELAKSVTLFEDADFAESGFSMGVSGPGCKNVPAAGVASSLTADGTVRMWAKKDCKGELRVVNGDVRDLADIGFDNAVASVRLG